jgi:membrane protease YdiL (CAAX protease family)
LTPEPDPAVRRRLILEIGVVLGLAVLPDIATAVFLPHQDAPPGLGVQALGLIERSVRVVLPLLYIMWRSGEPWSDFGIRRIRWIRDPAIGFGAWVLALSILVALRYGTSGNPFGFSAVPKGGAMAQPRQALDWVFVASIAVSNGFAEELSLRAFLQTRIQRLWGSTGAAIAVTAGLASLYHVYGGFWFAVNAAVFNTIVGMVFAATRRFWPAAFAHVFGDFLPSVFRW